MSRRLAHAVALLAMLAACGESMFSASEDAAPGLFCPGNVATRNLDVSPQQIALGDAVDIEIRWLTWDRVSEPAMATLVAGLNGEIEVEIPLSYDPSAEQRTDALDALYVGTQLNPFGVGAPEGTVSVLASGTADEACMAPATAATTFELLRGGT